MQAIEGKAANLTGKRKLKRSLPQPAVKGLMTRRQFRLGPHHRRLGRIQRRGFALGRQSERRWGHGIGEVAVKARFIYVREESR